MFVYNYASAGALVTTFTTPVHVTSYDCAKTLTTPKPKDLFRTKLPLSGATFDSAGCFWRKSGNSSTHKLSTVWESTFTICVHLNPVLITPHWKELWSCNLCRSAPLEMLFSMKSFFAVVKIFRIWLKTMDYSPWFELWGSKKSLEERIPSERASQGEQNDKISTS